MANPVGSGAGSRPTTSGGVENMGGGESFSRSRTAAGASPSGPAPKERMQGKRPSAKAAKAAKGDDSAASGLKQDPTPAPDTDSADSADAARTHATPRGEPAAGHATIPEAEPARDRTEQVRRAAYAAYERRAGQPGSVIDDWLEGEAEVSRRERGTDA